MIIRPDSFQSVAKVGLNQYSIEVRLNNHQVEKQVNMKLHGHLLYIDITQICGIGCAFCMYSDKHNSGMNMELSTQAKENLASLINSPEVKRISVSGEGEPLNNARVFHEILSLSDGGKSFEFITSGFFPHDKLTDFYDETSRLVTLKSDTCNIRLSSDHHHIEKIRHKPHGFSIHYLSSRRPPGLTFSFRSVDTDRAFTQGYLIDELARWGLSASIEYRSALEDVLIIERETFSIDYKNLVHPSPYALAECLDLQGYIQAIEKKVGKRFTLGSLNKSPQVNGIDLTIKPNGDMFFYGIENERLGNIHIDRICWEYLAQHVRETPLVKALYTQPFSDLLSQLADDRHAQHIIKKVNNPYWLIKEIANHDGLLERMIVK